MQRILVVHIIFALLHIFSKFIGLVTSCSRINLIFVRKLLLKLIDSANFVSEPKKHAKMSTPDLYQIKILFNFSELDILFF